MNLRPVPVNTVHKLKLITLNVEGDRHLNRVIPFLQKENPDVLCLQEIFEDTASKINLLGYTSSFLPMTLKAHAEYDRVWGVALFVKSMVTPTFSSINYHTTCGLKRFDPENQEDTVERGVVLGTAVIRGVEYRIATTHFTWSKDGNLATPAQIAHMDSLIALMSKEPPHILCGDFNIPRGRNPLYNNLAAVYEDCIPQTATSSLDRTFHRLGNDPEKSILFDSFLVDYIFSQAPYSVHDVRLTFGISDHAAVVGTVAVRV